MDEKLIREVVLSFRSVQRKIHQYLQEEAAKRDITTVQLFALGTLKREPHLTLGELAERVQVNKSTMSGIVDRLVKANYLTRGREEGNRRALNLQLTAEGLAKVDETYDLFFNRLERVLEIETEELEAMLDTHKKMIALLERKE
ncbi:MarR family winged helix-turn-helix transcriptional regulator [Listeria booriae]|uniref:MarR family transcriptional regulator n=1 Tax=Listeria booriae TaxID=1552123 RepID=A0A842C3G8_9LIST|nr:MarR family transcriptional regulator [Listeria booriae]MBC1373304.1 MarR family transcriptional regulator [Listeria booriae]MBC1945507.1 MarR family transcriptional regulator [Listeria booriae]MBC2168311.1 MarR family transcriptional regulator [Listeria booriae]MBC2172419.1 MarR family transcriptional regulator [Listeria booriae]MBC2193934.1 MarR family transcriptional regulator [Listeria booriae]